MKKLTCFFILIFGLISCSKDKDPVIPANREWTIINEKTYNDLTDIEFYGNDFGVISGSFGTLLKTENGGDSWEELNVGINHSFLTAFILSENEFFTSRIGIYKTGDGGESFQELSDLSNYAGSIFSIHFFDSENGLIYKDGLILKTVDGGQNWDVVYNNAGYASSMQFVSDNIGFIFGGITYDGNSGGEIHKTTDGGNTWNSLDVLTSEITSSYFVNEKDGYFANFENQLYKTDDGGQNWQTIGSTPILFIDMLFLDSDIGYGIGYQSIYKTEDGGKTWNIDYTSDDDMIVTAITQTPNGTLYSVTSNGLILKK